MGSKLRQCLRVKSKSKNTVECWTKQYPEVLPDISLDAFYNKHIIPSVKEQILEFAKSEGEQFLGMPMTYSIIEQVKENLENLLKDQPEHIEAAVREPS